MKRHYLNRVKSRLSPLNERIPRQFLNRAATIRKRTAGPAKLVRASLRSRRESHRQSHGPLVTIVVPIYNVEEYLSGFLSSVVIQTYSNLEILIVDDGSPDRSAAIARRWSLLDRRIRIITKLNGGLGSARNAGIDAAQGEYITFADSDDELHPRAIAVMVASLRRSGSDFVVGGMKRQQGNRTWTPNWAKSAHREDRFGIRLEDHPEILLDVFAWNKLWRTEFFRSEIGGFPEGITYEDQEPSVKSYLRARCFDVIRDPVYYWKIREDGSSITQQKARLSNLRDRLEVTKNSAVHILDHPSREVRDAWYAKTFGVDLIQYVELVPRTDRAYFDLLAEGYQQIIALCEPDFWSALPIYIRLATLYTYRGDEASLSEVLSGRIERGDGLRLSAIGSSVIAKPGYIEHLAEVPDDEFFAIDPTTLPIITRAIDCRWLDDDVVRVSGSAFCRSVFDGQDGPQSVSVALVNVVTGEREVLKTESFTDTAINRYARSAEWDCAGQGFTVEIDTSQLRLRDDSGASNPWRFEVSLTIDDGIVLSDRIQTRSTDGGASVLGFAAFSSNNRAVLRFGDEHGLFISSVVERARATHLDLHGRTLDLTIESLRPSEVTALMIYNRTTGARRIITPTDSATPAQFRITVPEIPRQHSARTSHSWEFTALFDDGRSGRIALPYGQAEHEARAGRPETLSISPTRDGQLRIVEQPFLVTCDRFDVDTNTLTVAGHIPGRISSRAPELTIVGPAGAIEPASVDWDARTRRYSADFALERKDWSGSRVGLPTGGYTLRHLSPRPALGTIHEQWASVLDAEAHSLPAYADSQLNTLRFTRTSRGKSLWITIEPLLSQSEVGLHARYTAIRSALDENAASGLLDAVVFESYHGKRISDSTLALFERIRESFPALDLYWSVNSPAVSVPAGSTPLIMGTAEWIRVVHRARYLLNNSNFPGYFRKQPGQRYLQTWHGTPLKRIAEDMPPGNLSLGYRVLMRREVKSWDLLLAQNAFAAQTIPKAFRYTGPVLDLGYPRNDALAEPVDPARAEEIRARLGIESSGPIVLFAPTFRDGKNTAGATWLNSGFEFEAVLPQLPADATLLLRGHSNTSHSSIGEQARTVIDVSDYGEISDLFLITDVLITDYSSMMFDFVVTGKPVLFFVPDLDEYASRTRGFYLDFTEICPGPMFTTSDALAEGLSQAIEDQDSLIDTSYHAFVARFAPRDDGHATDRVLEALVDEGWFSDSAR